MPELTLPEFKPPVRYRDPQGSVEELASLGAAIQFVRSQAASEPQTGDRRITWEGVWSSLEHAQDSGSPEKMAVGRDCLVRKLAAERMLVFSAQKPLAYTVR